MVDTSLPIVELVVRTMARTVVDNEKYFCDLDLVVGDGDFGYSLARGFEKVLDEFDALNCASVGAFLKRVGVIITSRCGGTSDPLWGTAFLGAGGVAGARRALSPAMSRRCCARRSMASRNAAARPGARRSASYICFMELLMSNLRREGSRWDGVMSANIALRWKWRGLC